MEKQNQEGGDNESEEKLPNVADVCLELPPKTDENKAAFPNKTDDIQAVENEAALPNKTDDIQVVENEAAFPNKTDDMQVEDNEAASEIPNDNQATNKEPLENVENSQKENESSQIEDESSQKDNEDFPKDNEKPAEVEMQVENDQHEEMKSTKLQVDNLNENRSEVANLTGLRNESLSIISTYSGDDDSEDDVANPNNAPKTDEEEDIYDSEEDTPVVNNKADFSKAQSSSSSSESDESSSSENASCDDSDDEVIPQNLTTKHPKFNKNPLELDNLPPIENLSISVKEDECMAIGKVFSIVDRLLVVESFADTPALMLDTILFTSEGQPIGQIYDVFGQIKKPFYSIRFNKNEDILGAGLEVENLVYCAPKTEHTKYIFTNQLLKDKGSDASWIGNEEPPTQCLDYSDDEQERNAKKKHNRKPKTEEDDDVLLVKVEQADSPARKRYLSFEEQMNRNNTLRTKAYKRAATTSEKPWDGGWHNYKRNSGTPLPERNREFTFVRGAVYRPPPPANCQWLNQPYSQPSSQQPRARSQPLFQFGGNASFTQQMPFPQNFPRFRMQSGPCNLGPPPQGFQSKPQMYQNYPQMSQSQNFQSFPVFGNAPYSYQNFQPLNTPGNFQSPPPFQNSPSYSSGNLEQKGSHCKCFQSNHRPPPPVPNQGGQRFQPRIPFIPGFVSSPPPSPMQMRPSFCGVASPPAPQFSSFPQRQPFPVQYQFMGNGTPPFRNAPPPSPT